MTDIWYEDAEKKQPKIIQLPKEYRSIPVNVLVLGAENTLNVFLISELLHQTKAYIFCITTVDDKADAYTKVREKMICNSLWDDKYCERLRCYAGDITCDRFGIAKNEWSYLEENIDLIFHNDGTNSFLMSYKSLFKSNVFPIIELIKFASTRRLKKVIYFSMANILCTDDDGSEHTFVEDQITKQVYSKYGLVQSKWVAESLLRNAAIKGIPIIILRLPHVIPPLNAKQFDKRDFFWLRIKMCIKLGLAPDISFPYYLIPTDILAQIAVHISLNVEHGCFIPIVPDNLTWKQIFETFPNLGYDINFISLDEFVPVAVKFIKTGAGRELMTMLPFLRMKNAGFDCPYFENSGFRSVLTDSGIACPDIYDIVNVINRGPIGAWLSE